MNLLNLIGRTEELFTYDIEKYNAELGQIIGESSFLVIGGAGSIGQAVTKEIFKRNPRKLHVVDISENNIVELVRDIRSSIGYIRGDFQTFAIGVGSLEYDAFIRADGAYDYVLNLSALKHVRSEKDPFTLMRMIDLNIFSTEKVISQSVENRAKKYFCVSTDKAVEPVNMMGASKRIMEMFLMRGSSHIDISTARFANVAFSDGSLLHGFTQRIKKQQPIVAPRDIRRYFVIPKESGELCLMSCIFGENRDIYFPKLSEELHLMTFSDIAVKYLRNIGYEAHECDSEEEARSLMKTGPQQGKWPCLFTESDTTGEKDFEEFYTGDEVLDMKRYRNIGIIKNRSFAEEEGLENFRKAINEMKERGEWTRDEIIALFKATLPDFNHKETGKYLDSKM